MSPDRVTTRDRLATTAMNLASLELNRGDFEKSDAWLEKSIKEHESLRNEFPEEPLYQAMLGTEYSLLADLRSKENRLDEALEAGERSREILQELAETFHESVEHLSRFATALHQQGVIQSKLGQFAEAKASVMRAREIRKNLIDDERAPFNVELDYHGSALLLTSIYVDENNYAAAIEVLSQTVAAMEEIVQQHPENYDAPRFLFAIYSACLSVLTTTDDFDSHRTSIQSTIDLTRTEVPFEIRQGYIEILAEKGEVDLILPLVDLWKSEIESTPPNLLRSINLLAVCLSKLSEDAVTEEKRELLQPQVVERVCNQLRMIKAQLDSSVDDILELFESSDDYKSLLENEEVMGFLDDLRDES